MKIMKKIKCYLHWMKSLWHPFHKTAYLLATPTHNNIGDLAIVVAEEKYLKECGYDIIVNITIGDCWGNYNTIARLIPKSLSVFLNGGGNMGDIYEDEKLRRVLLPLLAKHNVMIFPETIFYREDKNGREEKEQSIQYYNHKNIIIAAREQKSYQLMRELYPEAQIILSPDIVLAIGTQEYNEKRDGVLLCFRDDQEKAISDNSIDELKRALEKQGYSMNVTSMIYYCHIVSGMWEEVVQEKMKEIASSKLLITDRLHGMIFAAVTETPCIVFGNNHHKILGVYKWIENLDYIHFVTSVEEALLCVPDLYHRAECKFVFDMNTFSELKRMVQKTD